MALCWKNAFRFLQKNSKASTARSLSSTTARMTRIWKKHYSRFRRFVWFRTQAIPVLPEPTIRRSPSRAEKSCSYWIPTRCSHPVPRESFWIFCRKDRKQVWSRQKFWIPMAVCNIPADDFQPSGPDCLIDIPCFQNGFPAIASPGIIWWQILIMQNAGKWTGCQDAVWWFPVGCMNRWADSTRTIFCSMKMWIYAKW